jgi:hypothetical protein
MTEPLITHEDLEEHKDHKCTIQLDTTGLTDSLVLRCLDCGKVVFELYKGEVAEVIN